jgi:phosphoglycerate dehydrogenase-like enzyme
MPEVVVLIALSFPDPLVERLRAVSPELRIHVHPAQKAEELPADLLPDVEILYTHRLLPDPSAVPSLRWVQFHFAGVDHVDQHPLLSSGIQITTMSGASMPQMAEVTLMGLLSLGHRLPGVMADRAKKRWADDRFERYRPLELRGSTVGLVGYGSVGREVARLCKAFGARILATKRDLMSLDDPGFAPEGMGDPHADFPDRIYPPQALPSMAAECDFLVVSAPLTPETRGMVGRKVLSAMKPTAFLVDISRGGVVDHGALVEALSEKRIAGAFLDVYPVEPLPENSPLWDMPNILLTPHIAGASGEYMQRAADLFSENLRRYLTAQPLLNLYQPKRGY